MADTAKLEIVEELIEMHDHNGNFEVDLEETELRAEIKADEGCKGIELLELHDLGTYEFCFDDRAFTEQAIFLIFWIDQEPWAFYWTRGYGLSGGDKRVMRAQISVEEARETARRKGEEIKEYSRLAHLILEPPVGFEESL
jgi:hypothetical protein